MTPLLTERDASAALGLSVRTLQKWRLQGCGPRLLKLGNAVRYAQADIDQFVAHARRRSTSDTGGPGRGEPRPPTG
ncbi:MAG: helix-turn-helix domain-containing protein [bacterium]|nr:helix-turn-helix domain-containing protein [bacterium]